MLKEVKKRRAYEDIVSQLRRLIEKGRLKGGAQLPNETDLSEKFKVSRLTVREAILSLETMNLVERRQGDGTYVIASREEALAKPLTAYLFQDKEDIVSIFLLRKLIEPEIARLASEHATPRQIGELEKILAEQQRRLETGENPIETDTHFHFALAKMSKNKVLERLLLVLVGLLAKTREEYLQTKERKRKSLGGHQRVVAALRSGRGNAAKTAMRRHLEDVEKVLVKSMRLRG